MPKRQKPTRNQARLSINAGRAHQKANRNARQSFEALMMSINTQKDATPSETPSEASTS